MSSSLPSIVVVGSYATGLVMETGRIPVKGETLIGERFRQVHGGKGSNQAVQAARLGAAVSFVGVVGDDSFGKLFFGLAKDENIDTTRVRLTKQAPTGVGFIILDKAGNNIITVDLGANACLSAEDIDNAEDVICKADVMLLQLEIPLETVLYATRAAKKHGVTTVLNPAPGTSLLEKNLSSVDYLLPNESEALACLGLHEHTALPDEKKAERIRALGCRSVLFTLGERGSRLISLSEDICTPAFKVDVKDTVGAGDAFAAAFAVGIAEGFDAGRAARFANAAAGLSTTRGDTIPSYCRRAEVDAFLATA